MCQKEFKFDDNVDSRDKPRLSRHCREILSLLRQGRQPASALHAISQNHTARISNLRAAGYKIEIVERHPGGLNVYELLHDPDAANRKQAAQDWLDGSF